MTRMAGKTQSKPLTYAPEPVCKGCSVLVIDGEKCIAISPSCPLHGLEAVMLATRRYIAEPSPEEPIEWKGRE